MKMRCCFVSNSSSSSFIISKTDKSVAKIENALKNTFLKQIGKDELMNVRYCEKKRSDILGLFDENVLIREYRKDMPEIAKNELKRDLHHMTYYSNRLEDFHIDDDCIIIATTENFFTDEFKQIVSDMFDCRCQHLGQMGYVGI